ncbi:choice-of-anchor P family protein [Nocardioides sp. J54]|uniref:choice-of-anchor P family protein n=1 Tax=Nocardioides sp. J54 TaxID=935866 RepID=UPI0004910915|nr:choice-of-anchor P family protein [Nocardioides sp. J54]
MNIRKLLSLIAFLATATALVAVPAPAQAAPVDDWNYSANTGATYIKALGNIVSSDLTAQTAINGGPARTHSNSTAAANVLNLASVGAAETRTTATKDGANIKIESWSRTAGVSLLNGLIKLDAVESTVVTTGKPDGTSSAVGNHKLLGIKILGVNLPVNIPQNYGVNIPGVAAISLNTTYHAGTSELSATRSWAVAVQLLKSRDGYDAGTVIILSPVNHYLQEATPAANAPRLGGFAYSSRIQAKVGTQISVVSDPTAYTGTPFDGSNGNTLRNSTATVSLPGIATLGTLTSTSTSKRDSSNGNAEITNTNKTVGLNLLGGLIKADAIEVTASAKLVDGVWTQSMKMSTVNLVIAGQKIPIDVAPNTAIDIAGLGKVEINKQGTLPAQKINRIDGLKITLDTAQAGLPVGAVIELAIAATQMTTA